MGGKNTADNGAGMNGVENRQSGFLPLWREHIFNAEIPEDQVFAFLLVGNEQQVVFDAIQVVIGPGIDAQKALVPAHAVDKMNAVKAAADAAAEEDEKAEKERELHADELKNMVIDAAAKIAATKHSSEDDSLLYDKFINEARANNG
jgi:hypothetical protein